MKPIPAACSTRPFTLEQARLAGVTKRMLDGQRFREVTRGVHERAGRELPDDRDETERILTGRRLEALRLVHPDAVGGCASAAQLYHLPVPRQPVLHVVGPAQIRRPGIRAHRRRDVPTCIRYGLPVTTPARTFLDLAAEICARDLLAVGDAIVGTGLLSLTELIDAVDVAGACRGVCSARQVAALVRPGSLSAMESRTRHVIVTAGLPEPELNVDVYDSYGGWIARPDLVYVDARIALEYDGDHHRTDRAQWASDILRRQNLEDEGWVFRIVTARDIYVQPERFVATLAGVLRQRGVL